MEYRRLGASGLVVSQIGLGMMSYGDTSSRAWHLDATAAEPIVAAAVAAGVTLFDTADMYDRGASEEVTGQVLRRLFADRDDYVLATKVYYPMGDRPTRRGLSRKHVVAAVEASLRRLGTDHIDLYQVHRWDDATPISETMATLHGLVTSGKVRYLGASTMAAWQFSKAQHTARAHGLTEFVSMQNLYNLTYREEEREMIPLCLDLGVGVLPYSPLARGLLARTDATTRSGGDPLAEQHYGDADQDVVTALRDLAAARGLPPAQVALAWLARRPGVTATLVGATRSGHLHDAVASLDVVLTAEEAHTLEAAYRPHLPLGFE